MYRLFLFYLFMEYVRPQEMLGFPVFGLTVLLTICVVFWSIRAMEAPFGDPTQKLMLAFAGLAGLSLLYVVNQGKWFEAFRDATLYALVAGVVMPFALGRTDRLLNAMRFLVYCNAFHALYGIAHGGGGSGSFMGDENDFGLAMNIMVPVAFFLAKSSAFSPMHRILLQLSAGTLMVASILSESRGAFIGLAVSLIAIFFASKHKIRNLLLLASTVLIVVSFAPPGYFADMETINDPNDGTRKERINSWKLGWWMYLENPVLGVGANNFPWRVPEIEAKYVSAEEMLQRRSIGGRAAHSLYLTLLPETGTVGTLIFAAIIVLTFRRLYRLRRHGKRLGEAGADQYLIATGLLVALVAFLTGAVFLSVLYYPHFYYLVGLALAADFCWGRELSLRPQTKRGAGKASVAVVGSGRHSGRLPGLRDVT